MTEPLYGLTKRAKDLTEATVKAVMGRLSPKPAMRRRTWDGRDWHWGKILTKVRTADYNIPQIVTVEVWEPDPSHPTGLGVPLTPTQDPALKALSCNLRWLCRIVPTSSTSFSIADSSGGTPIPCRIEWTGGCWDVVWTGRCLEVATLVGCNDAGLVVKYDWISG